MFKTDSENYFDFACESAQSFICLLRQLHCFLQIDDVNTVSGGKDVGSHSWIPFAGLVTEVDACFEQVLHGNCGHSNLNTGKILRLELLI